MPELLVEFCGEQYRPEYDKVFTIGREADLTIDDENLYLHRTFLAIGYAGGLWHLENVGSSLAASVSVAHGLVQSWLSPGGRLPLAFPETVVWFTAGDTTYEFEILLEDAPFAETPQHSPTGFGSTVGQVELTPDQRLLLVALAEKALRNGSWGAGTVPSSAEAAKRLGWAITRFNRKLDNVCFKFAEAGVKGLHGDPTRLASSRKARLIEYSLSTRLITEADLELLPKANPRGGSHVTAGM
jgi:hypothetical protein